VALRAYFGSVSHDCRVVSSVDDNKIRTLEAASLGVFIFHPEMCANETGTHSPKLQKSSSFLLFSFSHFSRQAMLILHPPANDAMFLFLLLTNNTIKA